MSLEYLEPTNSKVEEILETPTIEIARNVAQIGIVNYALEQNMSVSLSEMAGDGVLIWDVAEYTKTNTNIGGSKSYESAIIYLLKAGVDFDLVNQAAEPGMPESVNDQTAKLLLREGLTRSRILPKRSLNIEQGIEVSSAKLAALSLLRADITKPLDRRLCDSGDEIFDIVEDIQSTVRPRMLHYPKDDKNLFTKSAYKLLSHNQPVNILNLLDIDPSSEISPWWQELTKDLDRLDALYL